VYNVHLVVFLRDFPENEGNSCSYISTSYLYITCIHFHVVADQLLMDIKTHM